MDFKLKYLHRQISLCGIDGAWPRSLDGETLDHAVPMMFTLTSVISLPFVVYRAFKFQTDRGSNVVSVFNVVFYLFLE